MVHKKLGMPGVSAFCESMSMMLGSGVQIDEAVALLRQGAGRAGVLEQALSVMQERTERGDRLSEAMSASGAFPEYAVRMAEAGEKAGRLDDALAQLAEYYEDQKLMNDRLKNAVIYPAVILFSAVTVLAAMLSIVLPSFTGVYNSVSAGLASSSYRYVSLSYHLCWAVIAFLLVIAALGLIGRILWHRGRRRIVEKAAGIIPLCACIMESLAMFRFISALSAYLASGFMQDSAVSGSMSVVLYKPVEERIRRCMDRMEEGHGIARAFYDEKLFEPVYGRMLMAGERSGSLEDVLGKLGDALAGHCSAMIDRLVSIIDSVLSVILILAVGVSLIGAMLPLVGIMNAIG